MLICPQIEVECSPVPHAPHLRGADVLHGDGDAVPALELRQVHLRFLLKQAMEEEIGFSTNRSRKSFKDSCIAYIHEQPNLVLVNLIQVEKNIVYKWIDAHRYPYIGLDRATFASGLLMD
jgi:hypothetical protein